MESINPQKQPTCLDVDVLREVRGGGTNSRISNDRAYGATEDHTSPQEATGEMAANTI
jgi:hypothetical protein